MKECYWSKGSFLNLGSINLGVSYMRLPNIEVIRYLFTDTVGPGFTGKIHFSQHGKITEIDRDIPGTPLYRVKHFLSSIAVIIGVRLNYTLKTAVF